MDKLMFKKVPNSGQNPERALSPGIRSSKDKDVFKVPTDSNYYGSLNKTMQNFSTPYKLRRNEMEDKILTGPSTNLSLRKSDLILGKVEKSKDY